MTSDKRILLVGLTCVDIISVAKEFPKEDSDQRALDCYWQRGGNASNSATVLSLLGAKVECLSSLSNDPHYQFIESSFKEYGVKTDHCPIHDSREMKNPTSIIILSDQSGSRTTLANTKDHIEVSYKDFEAVDLHLYRWIHFEGRRNCDAIKKMIGRVREFNTSVPELDKIIVSVELEKINRAYDLIIDQGDYVFISKDYAMEQGFTDKISAVNGLIIRCQPGSIIICPWGELGAAARSWSGEVYQCDAFSPGKIVDTLAAGDTFIASSILALNRGRSIQEALEFACRVAGTKCGMVGFKGLEGLQKLLP
ncbi:hypothetical protein ACJMK2_011429 [Sinanodonta woodiana]|uniref:Carbohydrate kinase PfkB domain-containing protein n=1 Tax=Sinanodonta woodiana TaxID=1069815 RepID=A0ABD3V6A6_SINWO